MLKKKSAKKTPESDMADYVRNIQGGLTGQELRAAQSYYNQLHASMQGITNWSLGTNSSQNTSLGSWGNTTTLSSQTNAYTSSPVSYTSSVPSAYGFVNEEQEMSSPPPKLPIEKDPEIGVGIDAFFAEKKRQEARK